MAEYIEREAALRANCYFCSEHLKDDSPCGEKCADYMKFMEIPAADVRPVVRGYIEEDEDTYLYCSECNCNITLSAYETPNGNLILRPRFCPNCGARMEES